MFSDLMNDNIDILKRDGSKHTGLKAIVQKSGITLDTNLLIEVGDLIQRNMSNGAKETYEVVDLGFREAFDPFPAHYKMEVKKLGIPEAAKAVQHITNYNFSGHNNRINQNSIDHSTNAVNIHAQALKLIEQLRTEIGSADLASSNKAEATEVIDTIQNQIESGQPKKSVVSALLNSLPQVANVATIAATLLSLIQAAK